jgi:hypothetical protein
MLATGLIEKVLHKSQEARRPDRFTQDFLETKLGFGSGSASAVIPLLKRCGFLAGDGTPTELYDQFRNPNTQGSAMAKALKIGFKDLYDRNEFVQDLPKDKLSALVTQITGHERNARAVAAIVATFTNLKGFANFDSDQTETRAKSTLPEVHQPADQHPLTEPPIDTSQNNVDLKLSYTINLNLPETTDPDVFNAIFKSLKENLLKG